MSEEETRIPQEPRNVPETQDSAEVEAPGWKRRVALFLGAQTISLFGSSIVQFAIMWYLTLELKSGWVITLYALFAFVPQALLSLFGGTLADRMNRKTVIIVSDTVIAVVTLGLAIVMALGQLNLWLIFAAVAVRSIGQGFQSPAVAALIPQLTPPGHLMRVNGINQSIVSGTALLAPVVGGFVYAVGGLLPTFWIDVVTALIGVGIMFTIPIATVRDGAESGSSYMQDVVAGVKYVWHHKTIAWLMVLFAVIFTLVVAPTFLTPLMLARSFSPEVWLLTVNEAVFSGGMVIGGILIATVAAVWHQGRMLFVSSVSFGVMVALLGLTPLLGLHLGLVAFYLVSVLISIGIPFFSAPVNTLIQRSVEQEYMGRVMSLISVVTTLGMPLGMVVLGPLADVVSVELILIVTGLLCVAFVLLSFAAPRGREVMRMSGVEDAIDEGGVTS